MREKADAIKAAKMRIFVRRGGPNYQAGLALMRKMGEETGAHAAHAVFHRLLTERSSNSWCFTRELAIRESSTWLACWCLFL